MAGARPSRPTERAEVVVVGGGPAGAVFAARLAAAGRHVILVERQPAWHWRACGVFSSPATVDELLAAGVAPDDLADLARPIPRLWVETPAGAAFALAYGHREPDSPTAVGFDRSRLDPLLLAMAAAAGVEVRVGTTVTGLTRQDPHGWVVRVRDATGEGAISARLVVGCDGVGSSVARALGVHRRVPLPARVGLTYHVPDGSADDSPAASPLDGRMAVLDGAYCGLAPVPGGRINVGIVLAGAARRAQLRGAGARASADTILRDLDEGRGTPGGSAVAAVGPAGDATEPLDRIAGISPIAHRVSRLTGDGWLLVGDAAGFLDPFTGEGLHRALVSARLAARAAASALRGERDALPRYERAMRGRFLAKDLVSWLVQLFLARPALFEYVARRLASRSRVRGRMGLLMGDLVPASGAFDPRFVAALFAP